MISLENTRNLLGITIKGDYKDLNELYNAISHYTEIYFTELWKTIELKLKNGKISEAQSTEIYQHYQEIQECILGLNYDIRHAYQGDRDCLFVENGADSIGRLAECIYQVDEDAIQRERDLGSNGNLYYSVNILYPWALYYLINLTAMLSAGYNTEIFKEMPFPYTEIQCRRDRSILEYFIMELWKCLGDGLGDKKAGRLFKLVDSCADATKCSSYYGEALCEYYCDSTKRGKKIRKAMLSAMILEYLEIGSGNGNEKYAAKDLKELCKKDYDEAVKYIQEETAKPFLSEVLFLKEWKLFSKGKTQISYVEQESFIGSFGDVDWDRLKW